MFSGVGADDAVATETAETPKTDPGSKSTAIKLETATKVQNAAGITIGVWGLACAAAAYYFVLRPLMKS